MDDVLSPDVELVLQKKIDEFGRTVGDDFWLGLIDSLNTSTPWLIPPYLPPEQQQRVAERVRRTQLEMAEASLNCLQRLTGNDELKTHADGQAWFHSAKPASVEMPKLIEFFRNSPPSPLPSCVYQGFVMGNAQENHDHASLYREVLRNATGDQRELVRYHTRSRVENTGNASFLLSPPTASRI